MTLPELHKERDTLIEKAFEGEHGCFTGDCPHDHFKDCYRSIAEHFFDFGLELMERERVRPLREAMKKISEWTKGGRQDLRTYQQTKIALSEVPELKDGGE